MIATLAIIVAGALAFGAWQESVAAGLFMLCVLGLYPMPNR